jgi:hypothetical protein
MVTMTVQTKAMKVVASRKGLARKQILNVSMVQHVFRVPLAVIKDVTVPMALTKRNAVRSHFIH